MNKKDIWKEILEVAELERIENTKQEGEMTCLLYTSPSPRDRS